MYRQRGVLKSIGVPKGWGDAVGNSRRTAAMPVPIPLSSASQIWEKPPHFSIPILPSRGFNWQPTWGSVPRICVCFIPFLRFFSFSSY